MRNEIPEVLIEYLLDSFCWQWWMWAKGRPQQTHNSYFIAHTSDFKSADLLIGKWWIFIVQQNWMRLDMFQWDLINWGHQLKIWREADPTQNSWDHSERYPPNGDQRNSKPTWFVTAQLHVFALYCYCGVTLPLQSFEPYPCCPQKKREVGSPCKASYKNKLVRGYFGYSPQSS